MRDRYQDLIERIITATLKGKIRSKVQVYQMLQADIQPGTGELFERCLDETLAEVTVQLESGDELQQAKALRKQRALKTIEGEWRRWQQENQTSAALQKVLDRLVSVDPDERLETLVKALDPNQSEHLNREQLQSLAKQLRQRGETTSALSSLAELGVGIAHGLESWSQLEGRLISWIYEQSQSSLGFGGMVEAKGPWASWQKAVASGSLKRLFNDLVLHQAVTAEGIPSPLSRDLWIEMAVVLQRLQLGLISWFDQQPYDPSSGKRLSIAAFLTFSVVWSQISERLQRLKQVDLGHSSFLMLLQVLRQFSQQTYFPLYGGLFAALSGESLKTLLNYLDQPLKQVPNTQSKARILTLLGYSQRALGYPLRAAQFHQQALEIAREAEDQPCEIASLNHLSRTAVQQQDYAAAIDHSQRALILARQAGDRLGEANALANLGYSQVFQAQAESLEVDQYETILVYLEQGLELSERLGDRPSQALCAYSLGVARQMLGQSAAALDALEGGSRIAQAIGDVFLQGMNYTVMAAAYQQLDSISMAIFTGALGMYLLHQIDSNQWRQAARVLSILYGQLGPEGFQTQLSEHRAKFLKQIGVDGYDYLPKLLAEYRESLE